MRTANCATTESIRQLETAVAIAASLSDGHLEGLAVMSLAASLSYHGDFTQSIVAVDRAGRSPRRR